MNKVYKFFIKKINSIKLPTEIELEQYASKYNKKEWDYLCLDKEFISLILEDINLADKRAKEIINNNK